ncbi:hypothetical protein SORBI_3001G163666 [Sorghum bicolor]|nr:hypothetical protein SORBI_3001G163666 [Sorghum bicolor]
MHVSSRALSFSVGAAAVASSSSSSFMLQDLLPATGSSIGGTLWISKKTVPPLHRLAEETRVVDLAIRARAVVLAPPRSPSSLPSEGVEPGRSRRWQAPGLAIWLQPQPLGKAARATAASVDKTGAELGHHRFEHARRPAVVAAQVVALQHQPSASLTPSTASLPLTPTPCHFFSLRWPSWMTVPNYFMKLFSADIQKMLLIICCGVLRNVLIPG